ncbi:MAG: hypothetical protein ACXVNM_13475 [Bacteroidia bacterium]
MKDLVTYFFSALHFKDKAVLFKKLLYLFLIFKCSCWLLNYSLLFSKNSVISDKEFDIGLIRGAAFFLYDRSYQWLCLWAILLVLLLSTLSLLKIHLYFIFDFTIWFIILNLHYRVYSTLTAGDFLLNQLLFFNCFIVFKNSSFTSWRSELISCLHNFGVIGVIIQVCFLYLASAITKLNDPSWMSGEAISITSQVHHFNLYTPLRFSVGSLIGHLLNFTVILYQLLFSLLIWFRKIKKVLLVIGIIIHLYIAFVMGLVSFGLLMLIPYIFFWPIRNKDKA